MQKDALFILTNELNRTTHQRTHHGYPDVPVSAPFPPSQQIYLHAQLATYDVQHFDGTTVGFNLDQTIAPGEHKVYLVYRH